MSFIATILDQDVGIDGCLDLDEGGWHDVMLLERQESGAIVELFGWENEMES